MTRHTSALGPIETGAAVLSPGFALPARYIIHTAAPIWSVPGQEGAKVAGLARCYTSSLALAEEHALASIALLL